MSTSDKSTDVRVIDPYRMTRWKFLFKALLAEKKCEEALKYPKPELDREKLEALRRAGQETAASKAFRTRHQQVLVNWKKKDRQAYGYLVRACEPNESAMEVVLREENEKVSTKELLQALEDRFSQKDQVGIVQAKLAAFNSIEIGPKESVETFVNRLLEAKRELVELGCVYVDHDVFCLGRLKETLVKDTRFQAVALTLRSSPHMKWDEAIRVVLALEASTTPTPSAGGGRKESGGAAVAADGDGLAGAVETIRRLKAKYGKQLKELNGAWSKKNDKDQKKKIKCFSCGKMGHKSFECRAEKKKKKCDHCGMTNHSTEECRKRRKTNSEDAGVKKSTHFDDDFDELPHRMRMMRVESDDSLPAEEEDEPLVTMDSGATSHIVSSRSAEGVSDTDIQKLRRVVQTGKKGVTFATTGQGRLGTLQRVLIAEDGVLEDSVVSVPQMDRDGKWVIFGGGHSVVLDSNLDIVAVAPLRNDNSYKFRLSDFTKEERLLLSGVAEEEPAPERLLLGSAQPTENLTLWHNRLGHRNQRDLGHAIAKGLVQGPKPEAAKNTKHGVCEACAKAKSTRHSFQRAHKVALDKPTLPLQPKSSVIRRMSTDLKGPMSVAGPRGERHMQLYTEDDTKWRVCKTLVSKADTLAATKQLFKVELASGCWSITATPPPS